MSLPLVEIAAFDPGTNPSTIAFNVVADQITQSGKIDVDPHCNGWTIFNKGTLPIVVNGIPLAPPAGANLSGESFSIGGNAGEIYVGRIDLKVDPADPTPLVVFIQKIYI